MVLVTNLEKWLALNTATRPLPAWPTTNVKNRDRRTDVLAAEANVQDGTKESGLRFVSIMSPW